MRLLILALAALACASAPAQTTNEKEIVRLYIEEMWNKNRPEMVGQLVATDYRHTTSTGAVWQGNDRVRELLQSLHKAFAELHYKIDAMTAEGGLVSTRATVSGIHVGPVLGFAPTNKRVTYQEWFWQRIRDGKIVEGWTLTNASDVLRRQASPDDSAARIGSLENPRGRHLAEISDTGK